MNSIKLDFKKYSKELESRYHLAYSAFLSHSDVGIDFTGSCIDFFESFKIFLSCYKVSFPAKYAETWTIKITIDNPGMVTSLGRKRNSISYPHNSNYESAMRKGVFKAFEIINKLKLAKTLPEKSRNARTT